DADHGHRNALVEPEASRGQVSAVENDRRRACSGRVLDRRPRIVADPHERGPPGDDAQTVAVEEVPERGRCPGPLGRPWSRELELERSRGNDGAREREHPVEHDAEPGPDHNTEPRGW